MSFLPSASVSSRIAASVASVVAAPRISSTSGITGTGLKKCIPTKRSRRPGETAAARASIEIELVFEAKIAPAGARASSWRQSVRLTSTSSNTASTTRSASRTEDMSDVAATRARIASRAAWSSFPLATARSRFPAIRFRPASARARSGS